MTDAVDSDAPGERQPEFDVKLKRHDDLPNGNRSQLLHGPYRTPATAVGQTLTCVIRGRVKVAGFSNGRIPWPLARNDRNGGRGPGTYVVCGDLVTAIHHESSKVIQYWWGVGSSTVTRWRRALGVQPHNEGTRELWRLWRPKKLPRPCRGELLVVDADRLRSLRLAAGLTLQQIAEHAGWTSSNTYGQLEYGTRKRATKSTMERVAKALRCRIAEITRGDRIASGPGRAKTPGRTANSISLAELGFVRSLSRNVQGATRRLTTSRPGNAF